MNFLILNLQKLQTSTVIIRQHFRKLLNNLKPSVNCFTDDSVTSCAFSIENEQTLQSAFVFITKFDDNFFIL